VGTDPIHDLTGIVTHRNGANGHVPVDAVEAANAMFNGEVIAGTDRTLP
jgi:hypothetical protein